MGCGEKTSMVDLYFIYFVMSLYLDKMDHVVQQIVGKEKKKKTIK